MSMYNVYDIEYTVYYILYTIACTLYILYTDISCRVQSKPTRRGGILAIYTVR